MILKALYTKFITQNMNRTHSILLIVYNYFCHKLPFVLKSEDGRNALWSATWKCDAVDSFLSHSKPLNGQNGLIQILKKYNNYTILHQSIHGRSIKWSFSVVSNSLRPEDCSPPSSSIHGILQARILEWVAIFFSRGSSRPRDQAQVSHIASRCFNLGL